MSLIRILLLSSCMASSVYTAPQGFLHAPIRISDFSGIRAIPLSQPLQFQESFPTVFEGPVRYVKEKTKFRSKIEPDYNFGYSVQDTLTGDAKTREESRDGDVVRGSYTVADPDGRLRKVTYTADAENGFRAQVTYDGESGPVAIPSKDEELKPNFESFLEVEPLDINFDDSSSFADDDAIITEVRTIPQRQRSRPQITELIRKNPSISSSTFKSVHPITIPQTRFLGRQPIQYRSKLISVAPRLYTLDGKFIQSINK